MVDAHVVVLLLFYGVLTIPMIVTLGLILRRRTQQPIKYRGVWLLFVSGLGILFAWSWYMLFLVFEVSSASTHSAAPQEDGHPVGSRAYFCGEWQWILWLSNGAIMAGYFLRSCRILKIFHDHTAWVSPLTMQQQLNAEQMAHPANGSSSSGPHVSSAGVMNSSNVGLLSLGGTHARKLDARVYTERFMLSILFALLLFLVLLKLILDYAANVPLQYSGFGCHQSEVWGWLGVDAAEILFLLLGIWKLRAVRDDYGISTELTTVCVIWIICSLGLAISILLRRSDVAHAFGGSSALNEEAYLEFQSALWAVRNLAIFFTSLTWPLIQSYYNSFPPLWSNCDALCSLETLLKDIVCIQYFRNYLMSVSRVEWILAWVEMELFRDLEPDDTEVIAEQARRIYEKYVQLGAELEVHLSPASVHRLTREVHVGAPDAGCFEEAQAELFQLMEAEFPRFLSSPACESCLHELEKEEVLREVLEKSDMI